MRRGRRGARTVVAAAPARQAAEPGRGQAEPHAARLPVQPPAWHAAQHAARQPGAQPHQDGHGLSVERHPARPPRPAAPQLAVRSQAEERRGAAAGVQGVLRQVGLRARPSAAPAAPHVVAALLARAHGGHAAHDDGRAPVQRAAVAAAQPQPHVVAVLRGGAGAGGRPRRRAHAAGAARIRAGVFEPRGAVAALAAAAQESAAGQRSQSRVRLGGDHVGAAAGRLAATAVGQTADQAQAAAQRRLEGECLPRLSFWEGRRPLSLGCW